MQIVTKPYDNCFAPNLIGTEYHGETLYIRVITSTKEDYRGIALYLKNFEDTDGPEIRTAEAYAFTDTFQEKLKIVEDSLQKLTCTQKAEATQILAYIKLQEQLTS